MKMPGPATPVVLDETYPRILGGPVTRVWTPDQAQVGIPTIGQAARRIKFLSAGDLRQNGGQYGLSGAPAEKIALVRPTRGYSEGGPVVPVYPAAGYEWMRYMYKVLSIEPEHLIGYWPQGELSGNIAYDYSGHGHNGQYVGVTLGQPGIGDGRTSPLYDGSLDYTNIYSAALAAAFNPAEITLLIHGKAANAGVWADGSVRWLVRLAASETNYVDIVKGSGANALFYRYNADGTVDQWEISISTTGWFSAAVVVSVSGDYVRAYLNGVQQGADLTALGTWAGALSSTLTLIGARNTTPTSPWSGLEAHCALWAKALTPAQNAYVGVV